MTTTQAPLVDAPALSGADLTLAYRAEPVVRGASVALRASEVTVLVGPNGSGKSTLLRALARLHRVDQGEVTLADGPPDALGARAFARRVTMLSQSRPDPHGLAVADVVAFGRHPHRRRFGALDAADREAIDWAMAVTGVAPMAGRPVDELARCATSATSWTGSVSGSPATRVGERAVRALDPTSSARWNDTTALRGPRCSRTRSEPPGSPVTPTPSPPASPPTGSTTRR